MKVNILVNFLLVLALGYGLVVGAVYALQPRLIYYPQLGRSNPGTPKDRGLEYEAVELATADGEKLSAWWVPAGEERGAVVIFHGNAGNIAGRMEYLEMFNRLGYSSLIMDYRGFGKSTGKPSEQGTYRDAEAAWRWVTEEKKMPAGEVAILGESLGGAIAAWLAARTQPRALVLTSAFTSVPDLGARIYPFLPVRLLSRFSYDTLGALQSVGAPVLVAHSTEDELVPFSHGQALFETAREPKRFVEMRGGHNDACLFARREWADALAEFLESAARSKS